MAVWKKALLGGTVAAIAYPMIFPMFEFVTSAKAQVQPPDGGSWLQSNKVFGKNLRGN